MDSSLQPRADRRQQALSVFGVIQYRKRLPPALEDSAEFGSAESMDTASVASSGSAPTDGRSGEDQTTLNMTAPIVHSIEDLKAVANGLGEAPDNASELETVAHSAEASEPDMLNRSSVKGPAQEEGGLVSSVESGDVTRQFELRFWRCGNLLAVETVRSKETLPQAAPETKHRLVNNIFRMIFGSSSSGASMYTHSWPDPMASKKADDGAAHEWLNLFLKGQKTKDPNTTLWLMGQDALELLLSDHGSLEELEGMRLLDNKLDMEIYVTSGLDAMIAKPYLKAGVWKLLRAIAP